MERWIGLCSRSLAHLAPRSVRDASRGLSRTSFAEGKKGPDALDTVAPLKGSSLTGFFWEGNERGESLEGGGVRVVMEGPREIKRLVSRRGEK